MSKIKSKADVIIQAFAPLYEKLKMYYVTGGMPESILMWI